jgi:hypothetical protein
VDFAAGPVRYGPKTSGEGLVTDHLVPHIHNYHKNQPLEYSQKDYKVQLLVDIVSFLRRTCKLLMLPPVDHWLTSTVTERVTIKLYILHDLEENAQRAAAPSYLNIDTLQSEVGSQVQAPQAVVLPLH